MLDGLFGLEATTEALRPSQLWLHVLQDSGGVQQGAVAVVRRPLGRGQGARVHHHQTVNHLGVHQGHHHSNATTKVVT